MESGEVFTSMRGRYVVTVEEHVVVMLFAGARRLRVCARQKEWNEATGEGRPLRGQNGHRSGGHPLPRAFWRPDHRGDA